MAGYKGYHYANQMRGWAVKHRADGGDIVAASDLDVAAEHMERLARSRDDFKEALIYLSDPARYDKTVTAYAEAALAAQEEPRTHMMHEVKPGGGAPG